MFIYHTVVLFSIHEKSSQSVRDAATRRRREDVIRNSTTDRSTIIPSMDDDACDEEGFPAPPTLDELPNEISLEQCERLLCTLHFAECREMCEVVYRTYTADPTAPRPIQCDPSPSGLDSSRNRPREDDGTDGRSDDDADDDESRLSAQRRRRRRRPTDAEEKAVIRRLNRPFEYAHEMTAGDCSCSDEESPAYEKRQEMIRMLKEDEAKRRWPPEDLYSRDAALISSCLWVQAKFKTVGLAGTIEEDYDALRGDVDAGTCGEWGPEARVFWCKLKWEEGAAKKAFSKEERAVERAILDTFKRAETLGIFNIIDGTLAPEDVRETWVEALGKLAWLYASQILAAQRDDKDAAYAWMDANASMLSTEILLVIKRWIEDANAPPRYETTISIDETTRRRTVTHEELRRPSSKFVAAAASSERRPPIGGDKKAEPSSDSPKTDTCQGDEKPKQSGDAIGDSTKDEEHRSQPSSTFDPVIETVREIARDPAGDVALRAYAVAAVSAYAAWSLIQTLRSWKSTNSSSHSRRRTS